VQPYTPALFQCVESAEDDAAAAAADFDAALKAAGGDAVTDALIIGVSCGLSATYVSSQLARAMDDKKGRFSVACIGFNPKKFARATAGGGGSSGGGGGGGGGNGGGGGGGGGGDGDTAPVNGTDGRPGGATTPSFRDVLWRMEEDEGGVLCASGVNGANGLRLRRRLAITPVVGPEAITGSSRIKGGTATKLVLDAAFAAATALAEGPLAAHYSPVARESATQAGATAAATAMVKEALMAGSAASRAASFSEPMGLAAVVDRAASCLSSGGQLHDLGGGAAGVLGLIDASEQVPTFGGAVHVDSP
jgi:N-acetylmuramic acid 6-phosphate (MurNAc-6-P) etherase